MKLERHEWAQLLRHLDTALDLTEPERPAWIEALALPPRLDAALREMLQDRRAIETGDFLAAGAAVGLPPLLPDNTVLGPWRLLRVLGRGGMATVWLARREDGAHLREVALKLPHPWVGSQVVVERFRRERRILSALQHPHIAQVLDAGEVAGQPWLALEYVEGRTILDHASAEQLSSADRLRLFLPVLRAVQHAHAQLVIHRDIKPANVLVDSAGNVKLLDFGVAKLLDDDGADTALTREGGQALTPQYASPEQLGGRPLGVASDVYSLGLLLYELLTGRMPYQLQRGTAASLEHAVLTAPVVRPSEAAGNPALRGDLDTVVLKAMALEPAERYASAEAMAQDIERHLASEPILARPASLGYRLRKLWGRHRLALSAAAAVGVALLAGGTVALWQAQTAQAEAQRAIAVSGFLADLFRTNSQHQRSAEQMQRLSARELLDLGAQRMDRLQASAPLAHADLLKLLGELHDEMGLSEQALALHQRSVTAAAQAYGSDARETALARLELAWVQMSTGHVDEALAGLEQARSTLARRAPRSADYAQARYTEARAYQSRDVARALAAAREAQQLLTAIGEQGYRSAMAHQVLGETLNIAAQPVEALQELDAAVRTFDALFGPDSMAAAHVQDSRADALRQLGRWREAAVALQRELDTFANHDANGALMATLLLNQSRLLMAGGERVRARAVLVEAATQRARHPDPAVLPTALDIETMASLRSVAEGDALTALQRLPALLARTPETRHLPRLALLAALAQVQTELGQLQPAGASLQQAKAVMAERGSTPARRFDVARAAARLALAQRDATAARAALTDAEQALGAEGERDPDLSLLQADVLLRLGDAAASRARTAALVPRLLADDERLSMVQRGWLALVAAQARRSTEPDLARQLAERALRWLGATQIPGSPALADARALLAPAPVR